MPNQTVDIGTIERGVYTFRAQRAKHVNGTLIQRGEEFTIDSTDPAQWDVLHGVLVLTRAPSKAFRLISVQAEGATAPSPVIDRNAAKDGPVDTVEIPTVPPVPNARKSRAKAATA